MQPGISRRHALRALVGAPAVVAMPARGQSILPDKGIRLLVGFSSGGGTDILARLVARRLERRLGRTIAVENRPGDTGAQVGELLKKGKTDGSLLGFVPSTTLASKLVVKSFPFDPLADIAPVSLAGSFQMALAVSSSSGVATFAEYIGWLKAGDSARARLGTAATDRFLEVFGMMLGREVGVPIQNVPYRGAGPLIADLQAGKIPVGCAGVPSLLPHHRGGRLKILLTCGVKRLSVARELPTATELGHPGLTMDEWYGFFTAPGTPPDLVHEWNRQIGTMLADRETAGELAQLGLDADGSSPQELTARITLSLGQWKSRLDSFGLTVND